MMIGKKGRLWASKGSRHVKVNRTEYFQSYYRLGISDLVKKNDFIFANLENGIKEFESSRLEEFSASVGINPISDILHTPEKY